MKRPGALVDGVDIGAVLRKHIVFVVTRIVVADIDMCVLMYGIGMDAR